MLRHPFFGVVDPQAMPAGENAAVQQPLVTGRRSFFGHLLAAGAGAAALLLGRTSAAQTSIGGSATLPGQSTARDSFSSASDGRMTTQAVGEEGGWGGGQRPGQVTTYALGEEGSWGGGQRPGQVTTYALGEEGSWGRPPRRPSYPPSGVVTTYAIGEEAGYYPPPRRRPPRYTTYALGEEGGYWYYR